VLKEGFDRQGAKTPKLRSKDLGQIQLASWRLGDPRFQRARRILNATSAAQKSAAMLPGTLADPRLHAALPDVDTNVVTPSPVAMTCSPLPSGRMTMTEVAG
jgi:hypothetical protein